MRDSAHSLWQEYARVRVHSLELSSGLTAEDQTIQSMPDASPTKWHLAHTTWFFEVMVLMQYRADYKIFDPAFHYLFNSYYEALGPRHARPQRGLLTRPDLETVHAYRKHVDDAICSLLQQADAVQAEAIRPILILGLQHEQQHQELIVTDILHALSCNPTLPAYRASSTTSKIFSPPAQPMKWLHHTEGKYQVGHEGSGFAFDNELPRHAVWLQTYAISDRLVTCGEYLQFIQDRGYQRADLWLSDGWASVQANKWIAPLYWYEPHSLPIANASPHDGWLHYGIHGLQPIDINAPVMNLSFYEAAAYAEWSGTRLPTEFEWEIAAQDSDFRQAFDHAWQWTRSSYTPYPGFKPLTGLAAEYNGKFMVGQQVLRGTSFATPTGHCRLSYRNFFPPHIRWQFSGLRLAKDL